MAREAISGTFSLYARLLQVSGGVHLAAASSRVAASLTTRLGVVAQAFARYPRRRPTNSTAAGVRGVRGRPGENKSKMCRLSQADGPWLPLESGAAGGPGLPGVHIG